MNGLPKHAPIIVLLLISAIHGLAQPTRELSAYFASRTQTYGLNGNVRITENGHTQPAKALATYFTSLAQTHGFNGNILIAENGHIVYSKSFGYADLATKRPNTSASAFTIASITKTFTATAILQLAEQEKLNVNDPVKQYLPEFPYATITIRHLMSHTSGMPSYGSLFDSLRLVHPDTVFTNKDILPQYASRKPALKYAPGDNGDYQNINFIFLAILIERVTGMPFQEYITANIFKPAGLTHTIFPTFAFYHYTPQEKKNLSISYRRPHIYSDVVERPDTIHFISRYWHNYNFSGFGELLSTTDDLLKYDQALYNNVLLRKETLDKAYTYVRLNNGETNPVGNGLGWQIEKDSTWGKVVLHGGGGYGLSAVLMRNITKNQTIIIIDNMHSQDNLFVNEMGRNALKMLNGEAISPPGKSLAQQCATLAVSKDAPASRAFFNKHHEDTKHYFVSEDEFNIAGYELMNNDKLDAALEIFKMNMELYPSSYNVYDSYGEALAKKGRTPEAIAMYRKSLTLKPDSQSGIEALQKLTAQKE